jgi:TPR repeat protein
LLIGQNSMAELQHLPHRGSSTIFCSENRTSGLAARGLQDLHAAEEAEQLLQKGLEFQRQQRYEDAFSCFERGVRLNPSQPELLHQLGACYRLGSGVPQNFAQSDIWCRRAANHGHALMQNNLGWDYAHGHGVPQSYEQAAEWYRKAAEQGFSTAQVSLAHLYRDGNGVPQDNEQAEIWYRKAAAQGDMDAKAALAVMPKSEKAQPDFRHGLVPRRPR